jgi:hypothetical protein
VSKDRYDTSVHAPCPEVAEIFLATFSLSSEIVPRVALKIR